LTFEHGAALGTALAALFALWLAERRTQFDARRSSSSSRFDSGRVSPRN
jgi:hypothetical protein